MLSKLKGYTGSTLKALDVLYVIEGIKPVARIISSENSDFFNFLEGQNLGYEVSNFKVVCHQDGARNYSDKGKTVNKESKDGSFFVYISKDKDKARMAKEAEEQENHVELGKLLGYPECCTRFFDDNFDSVKATTNDLTIETFRGNNHIVFDWHNNNCLRGFDISLLSHFPCSFNCRESAEIAKKNLEVIEKYDMDLANYMRDALRCGLFYSDGVGVYSFKKIFQAGNMFRYWPEHVIPSNKNDFYNILARRNFFKVLGKNKFQIEEVLIEDENTFFGLFR